MKTRTLKLLFLSAAVAGLAGARPAHAQRGIDTQIVQPTIDSFGIFGTDRARTSHQWDFGFQFGFRYAQNPLHLKLSEVTTSSTRAIQDTAVVNSTSTFHLSAHFGLHEKLQLGFDVPMTRQTLNKTGYGEAISSTGQPTGFYSGEAASNVPPSDVSPGDMRWALKSHIHDFGPIALGAAVTATLPFGDERQFLGSHSFTVEPKAIVDVTFSRFALAANLGYRWHDGKDLVYDPNPQPNNSAGLPMPAGVAIAEADELTSSAAVLFHANPFISVAAGIHHLEPLAVSSSAPKGTNGDAVTDAIAGVLVHPFPDLTVSVGAGFGVQKASRQEDFSVLAGIAWAPEGEGGGLVLGGDRDHDGIADSQDLCPDEPEDQDGFEDDDGCPDPDNDQDGVADAQDRCPNDAEDRDGFQDEDGCPDPDNDGDGVADIQDRCPNEAEDHDGFQDDDGCPDPDNDGDGIPDEKDKCPNEPETFNGVDDDDGCPDVATGGRGQFEITEKVGFGSGAKIEPAMAKLLDEIAARLKRNAQVKVVRIEGHTDTAGSSTSQQRLSQQRADAVREYLMRKGVEPERLQSVGYGSRRPLDTNSTREGRAKNRRVELIVVE